MKNSEKVKEAKLEKVLNAIELLKNGDTVISIDASKEDLIELGWDMPDGDYSDFTINGSSTGALDNICMLVNSGEGFTLIDSLSEFGSLFYFGGLNGLKELLSFFDFEILEGKEEDAIIMNIQ